jgi:hypothetical protein
MHSNQSALGHTLLARRMSRQVACGGRGAPDCLIWPMTSLDTARRSRCLMAYRRPSAWYWPQSEWIRGENTPSIIKMLK